MQTGETSPADQKPQALTQPEVDRYVRRDNRLKLLQKAHETQKEQIKQRLLAGARCPMGGAAVLAITEQERKEIDWKQEATLLSMEMYGEEGGRTKIAEREAAAPRKKCYLLAIRRNLRFDPSGA